MNKTFGDALKEWLTEKYLGKKVYSYQKRFVFMIEQIEITDTIEGLEILLLSNDYKTVDARCKEWYVTQRKELPIELINDWYRVNFQIWCLNHTKSELPEIVD